MRRNTSRDPDQNPDQLFRLIGIRLASCAEVLLRVGESVERATGVEPATSSLGIKQQQRNYGLLGANLGIIVLSLEVCLMPDFAGLDLRLPAGIVINLVINCSLPDWFRDVHRA
jgi:hypothetical protein